MVIIMLVNMPSNVLSFFEKKKKPIRQTYLSHVDSFRQMTILCMAWAIMLGGGTGAMAYRCYQVWDSYFLWRKQSMFGSTDPFLIYRVCITFATVSDCLHEIPFNIVQVIVVRSMVGLLVVDTSSSTL